MSSRPAAATIITLANVLRGALRATSGVGLGLDLNPLPTRNVRYRSIAPVGPPGRSPVLYRSRFIILDKIRRQGIQDLGQVASSRYLRFLQPPAFSEVPRRR